MKQYFTGARPHCKLREICAFFLLLPIMTRSEFCMNKDSARQEKIGAIFTTAGLRSDHAPGAAVLVIKDDRVVFERGYGVTDLRSLRAIDVHTSFRLASVSKQFTAMATMLLVRDGKLHYDDRLTDILPDFPEYGRAITIRNLLNHTSGLEDYEDLMPQSVPGVPVEQFQIHDTGVLDLLKQQKSTRFPAGSKWAYSNSGYVLLGLVVSKVSGEPFPDFLQDRIFAPLRMKDTIVYVRGKNEVPNRALGHSMERGTWKETDQSLTSATLGDGGVYSSIDDLAKWDRALRRHTLLSKRQMKPAVTPVVVAEGVVTESGGTPADYGFGWFLNAYNGHPRMWHYGETIGFRTTIQRFVTDRLSVIVLSNRANVNPGALALQVADLFLERR